MGIIIPYSGLDTESTNPATAARYPALKHFFQCKETSGLTLTDSVGGLVATVTTMTFPDSYSVSPSLTSSDLTSGSWTTSTSDMLILAIGDLGGNGTLAFGNSSSGQGDYFQMSTLLGSATARDNTTSVQTADGIVGSASIANGATLDFGGNMTAFSTTGGAYTAGTPIALTGVSNLGAAQSKIRLTGITSLYAFMVFSFSSGLPGDISAAVRWMEAQAKAGNKVIWPGWLYRA